MQRLTWTLGLLVIAAGCASARGSGAPTTASVTMRASNGTELGTLRLETTASGIRLSGALTGLTPGAHGMHLHAVGRCDGPDFTSAGAHFNPRDTRHGLVNPQGPHAGDLPAIAADANGRATVDASTTLITLDSTAPTGVFDADGTALVIHAANDDQRTDPSGNSGARVACGVVTMS